MTGQVLKLLWIAGYFCYHQIINYSPGNSKTALMVDMFLMGSSA